MSCVVNSSGFESVSLPTGSEKRKAVDFFRFDFSVTSLCKVRNFFVISDKLSLCSKN